MEFLNKYNLTPIKILKIVGLGLLGIVVLAFVFNLLGSSFGAVTKQIAPQSSFGIGNLAMEDALDFDKGMAYSKNASSYGSAVAELSTRNIAPGQGIVTGDTAEDYEVTQYNARIETRQLEQVCAVVSGLKPRDYVIFENANEYDTGCNYTFKVKQENKEEILAIIEGLNPKTLTENIRTIKRQIDDYTSKEAILKNKLAVIEDTLSNAVIAYDEISRLATHERDVESLAKIIDSKIRIIESLTQQRVNVTTQLDRLSRSKAEQLDRLDYVYFYVNVYENKFVDPDVIKDSWKAAIKKFINNMNGVLQSVSVNLVYVIFMILQYLLYFFIIFLAIRYAWKYVKYIWRK
ncbi:MAG: hypothetical protein U9R06_01385 [Patescibacteria group bacterium]|nr:hypothetical protein [Patescibacteria group bacterium]